MATGGLYGFINRKGQWVANAKYQEAKDFSDGMASVRIGGNPALFFTGMQLAKTTGKWGYINTRGQEVIPPQFDEVSNFAEDLAVVNIGARLHREAAMPWYGGGTTWVIDKKGTKVDLGRGQPSSRSKFSDGLIPFGLDGQVGLADKTGRMVVPQQWVMVGPFSEGLAVAGRESLGMKLFSPLSYILTGSR